MTNRHFRCERTIKYEDIQLSDNIEHLRNAVRSSIARELANMILNNIKFNVLEDPENHQQKVYADMFVDFNKPDENEFSYWEMINLTASKCHKCGFIVEKLTNYFGNCGTIMLKKYMQNWVDKIL